MINKLRTIRIVQGAPAGRGGSVKQLDFADAIVISGG